MSSHKQRILIMGQTPPPWHGQAVATQLLFDHDWPGFDVRRVRMAFSNEMEEIGRVHFQKLLHLLDLWKQVSEAQQGEKGGTLIYPPASPHWVPILRDLILLPRIRRQFDKVVYIYHAGGLGEWCAKSRFRRWIAGMAYGRADLSLEVARENPAPHEILRARSWAWTPYGVEVPLLPKTLLRGSGPTVVLFVGSLQEGKGVVEVIKTAAILKQQGGANNFRFKVVGRWFSKEFEENVRHMLSELELEGMVELPGQLTGSEKWQAYAEADAFFFPTHYASEAFPLVLIEAVGSGLPVVTTRWRGIPDLFDGCPVATLCSVRSPEEYANALLAIQKQSAEGVDFSGPARLFYEERYLPKDFLAQIQSLVSSINSGVEYRPTNDMLQLQPRRAMLPLTVQPCRMMKDIRLPDSRCEIIDSSPSASRSPIHLTAYLADQNPGHDRSFGISRMSQVVLEALHETGKVNIDTIASTTSQQAPAGVDAGHILPWGTRRKWVRFLTDHFHPLFIRSHSNVDAYYFPKGYLPLLSEICSPSVVTIHDTIIQYDADHYPRWRNRREYTYWAMMLKHTLRKADRILTVSESSKRQIQEFMERHGIPRNGITVTYEPCLYERSPQPVEPAKENYVIHLASCEPHKRTAHLIRWWHEAEAAGRNLPMLHLIGTIPAEVNSLLASSHSIVKSPFLDEAALQAAYLSARALILPSEIEGFGLPALEAYYLGTPVCFVRGTSVEEILGVATDKGGFSLESADSLLRALDEVMAMPAGEVRECGLKLRETYAAQKVAERMMAVFDEVRNREG